MPNTIKWEDPEGYEDLEDSMEPVRVKEFPMGADGPSLFLVRSQPHGFFEVATERGPVPGALKGKWTNQTMAGAAIQGYIDKNVSSVKFNPKGEPAKIKNETETMKTATLKKNFKAKNEKLFN
jgi:hypothetical protein